MSAATEERKIYTIEGRVQPAWNSFVRLNAVGSSFHARQEVLWDGKFKFKNLPAGTYSLSVLVPRMGEFRQTYSVGPGTADPKGHVKITMILNPARASRIFTPRDRFTVPASRLMITEKARKEYWEAQKGLKKEDRAAAVIHLEKAIELSPQFASAWNTLGVLAYQDRNFELAEERFREAGRLDPLLFEPIVNLGGVMLQLDKIEEALVFNQKAVERRPKDPLANVQLGLTYMRLHNAEQAVRHLQEAKRIDPGHYSYPQLILSDLYLRGGNRIAAAGELEDFLQHHPDYESAETLRAGIRKLRGYADARPQAEPTDSSNR